MKYLLMTILFYCFGISQQIDSTSIILEKREYIGVIKGIKYLEAKDSLVSNLIIQYESQIDNYRNLHNQDSTLIINSESRLKEVMEDRKKISEDLYSCENPPFYRTSIAYVLYGVLISILLIIQ